MKFTLVVRIIDERDLCSTTPFAPEDDEYEVYLSALLEDLSRVDAISEVKRNSSTFQIETACSMPPADLKKLIKPAFNPDTMRNMRFVSLLEDVAS